MLESKQNLANKRFVAQYTGCLKKRSPFFKIDIIPLFSRNLSSILYGQSKMILLCSVKDSIHSNTSKRSDVIMTPDCIYDNIVFFTCTVENTDGI